MDDDDDSLPLLLNHILYGDTDDEWNLEYDDDSKSEDEELCSEVDFCKIVAALYFLVLRKSDPEKWK
eukprot:12814846-Ditylum_brightwellii.AAC.1